MAKKGNVPYEVTSGSVEETQALGERLGRLLAAGDVVALHGELGSGKTTLVQGIAQGMGYPPDHLKSPTFVLMREYAPGPPVAGAGAGGETPLIHLDGYRLEGAGEAAWLDTELMFSPHKVTVIEWAERFEGLLPDERLDVRLAHVSTNRRRLTLAATGAGGAAVLAKLQGPPT